MPNPRTDGVQMSHLKCTSTSVCVTLMSPPPTGLRLEDTSDKADSVVDLERSRHPRMRQKCVISIIIVRLDGSPLVIQDDTQLSFGKTYPTVSAIPTLSTPSSSTRLEQKSTK